jgi:hypothetical protein
MTIEIIKKSNQNVSFISCHLSLMKKTYLIHFRAHTFIHKILCVTSHTSPVPFRQGAEGAKQLYYI